MNSVGLRLTGRGTGGRERRRGGEREGRKGEGKEGKRRGREGGWEEKIG